MFYKTKNFDSRLIDLAPYCEIHIFFILNLNSIGQACRPGISQQANGTSDTCFEAYSRLILASIMQQKSYDAKRYFIFWKQFLDVKEKFRL